MLLSLFIPPIKCCDLDFLFGFYSHQYFLPSCLPQHHVPAPLPGDSLALSKPLAGMEPGPASCHKGDERDGIGYSKPGGPSQGILTPPQCRELRLQQSSLSAHVPSSSSRHRRQHKL